MMNEKMKIYYLYDKSFYKKDYFLLVIYHAIESLINVSVINNIMYYFMIFFETFQIISLLSLFNTNEYVLIPLELSYYIKIINLFNIIDTNIISYNSYVVLVFFHFTYEVFSFVILLLIGLKKYQAFTNFLSYFLSFKLSLFIHNLVFYEIFITLPLYFCNTSGMLTNFPDKKCFTTEHIILIVMNSFLLITKLFQIILASLIFNDFSFYISKLPWSSSFNYNMLGKNVLKIYLILFSTFLNKNTIAKYLLFYLFILYIIIQRYNTPNLFKRVPTIVLVFFEGFYIIYGVFISVSFFLNISEDYLYVYALIISFSFGMCYIYIFRFYEIKNLFTHDFKYMNDHNRYITILQLKDLILSSDDDRNAFLHLITYFNIHNQDCKLVICSCHQIKEILHSNKTLKFELQQNLTINVSKEDLIPKESNIKMGRDSRIFTIKDNFLRIWGKFLKDLILDNKNNNFITVELANIIMFFLKNPLNALFYISKINEETSGFCDSYMVYISKINMMKKNIVQDDSFSSDIQKFLEYNQHFENFTKLMNKTVGKCKTFWNEMKKNVFIPNIVEKNGNKVAEKTRDLEIISNKITKLNPSDYRFFKLYGSFLNSIWRWEDDAKEYILRAYNQIIFNRSIDFDDRKSDIFENMDAGLSIIASSENKLGRVEYCNYSFASTFEYDITEVIGHNISKLMPWIIGIHHDNIILNNFLYSDMNMSKGVKTLPGYTKTGYVVPLKILIKLLPCIEHGLNYIGFVKKSVTYTKNSIRAVNSKLGFVLTDRNFRIICFDKNAEKALLLNKNLNYTLSKEHASNKCSLDIIFPQLSVKDKLDELRFSESTLFYNSKYIDQCYETIKVNDEISQLNKSLVKKIEKTVQKFQHNSKSGNQDDPNKNLSYKITMTEESYFFGKIQFFVFQLVIPEYSSRKNTLNECSNMEEEEKISEISIASIAGSIKESELKNKSQTVHNLLSQVKKTVFEMDSPRILKILLFIFILFLSYVGVASFIETYKGISNLYEVSELFKLSYNIFLENAYLGRVFHRLNIFLLMKSQIIKDFNNFNNTLQSQYYKTKILEEILQTNEIQNNINDIGLQNKNKYILQNDLIVSYKYKNNIEFVTERLNLPIKISNIVFEVENFLKTFADFNFTKDELVVNPQSKLSFQQKSGQSQNFIIQYFSLSDTINKGLNDYYIFFNNHLISNILSLLTSSTNDELFLFILGEVVCLSFIISYTVFYIIYNRTRLEILYLLTELTEEDVEKTFQEVEFLEKNINNILIDDSFFIKNNQHIFDVIKKNSETRKSVSPFPEKVNEKYSDIQKRSSLETSVLIQRNNNLTIPEKKINDKKINTINSLDISPGLNQIKHDKNQLSNLKLGIKYPENYIKQTKDVDEEKLRLSNAEDQVTMSVVNTTKSYSAVSDQTKLIQKYIWKSYITFFMFFSALLYSTYFIISFFKLKEEIVFDEKIISTMNLFYSIHGNFSSLIFNNTNLLMRYRIESFSKDNIFANYNSTKSSLFQLDDFFKKYKVDYQDFIDQYNYINFFDEIEYKFCYYYIDLIKIQNYNFSDYTKLQRFCDNSFYHQGYEFGLLRSSDLIVDLLNNFTTNPSIFSINSRYELLGNPFLNNIQYEFLDLFIPIHLNITLMYFNKTQELYSKLFLSYILKLILIIVYICLNFIYYFMYTYKSLLKQIVFNKAIIMMIPSYAFKKNGNLFNDFLRKFQ